MFYIFQSAAGVVYMPSEPVPADTGWDDDPAWTRPDPVSAEDREAWLDHLAALDDPCAPEEYPDPEDCAPLPGEDQLTREELAEISEAARDLAAAEAGTAAEMARLGGSLGLIAAAAERRGPGQPGSARIPAGESSSRAAAFGTGMALDVMPACPGLALAADAAVGPGDCFDGVSDGELAGVLAAWDRLEAHMAARKLAGAAPTPC
jgi:hypothetical protein